MEDKKKYEQPTAEVTDFEVSESIAVGNEDWEFSVVPDYPDV